MTTLDIYNRQSVAGSLYIRFIDAARVIAFRGAPNYPDGIVVTGNPKFHTDVSVGSKPKQIKGVSTYHFNVAPGEKVNLDFTYQPTATAFRKCEIWFSTFGSTDPAYINPTKRCFATFEVDTLETGDRSATFYISSENGVSTGIAIKAENKLDAETLTCRPGDPRLFYSVDIDRSSDFPTILSDANSESDPTLKVVAECADGLASTACGIHRSRVYYAKKRATGASYSNWLIDTKSEAMSWRFDDWECLDEDCGYRDDRLGAPRQIANNGLGLRGTLPNIAGPGIDGCEVPVPQTDASGYTFWDAKLYSCGFITSLVRPPESWTNMVLGDPASAGGVAKPPPPGETGSLLWWKPIKSGAPDAIGTGCQIRKIGTKGVKRQIPMDGDESFRVDFYNLDWLTNRVTVVSDSKPLSDFAFSDVENREFETIDGVRVSGDGLPESTIDLSPRVSQYVAFGFLMAFVVVSIVLVAHFYGFGNTRVIAPHAIVNAAAMRIASGSRAAMVP